MLGNFIFITLLLIFIKKLVKNIKSGIIVYLIFSLISPHLKIGNLQISFEIIAFFILVGFLLVVKPVIFSLYRKYLPRQHLLIFFCIFVVSSLIATLRFGSAIPWIAFIGYLRIIGVIFVLQYVMRDEPEKVLDRILSPVLYINLIVSIIQLTMPNTTKLFYDFYYKPSLTPLQGVLDLGYFGRAYGTFGTPVLVGVFSLLSFVIYLGFFTEKKQCKKIYLKIIISIVIGLLALSKTAILGIPLIFLCYCLLILIGVIKVRNRKIALFPFILIPVFMATIQVLEQYGTTVSYYLGFFTKPLEALNSRYDLSQGILMNTYSTLSDNWFIGVGGTPIANDFIGDSLYVGVLYSTGIIGFLVYFSALVNSTINNMKMRNTSAWFTFFVICIGGIAAPIHLDIISVSFIAYLFTKSELKANDINQ